MAPEPDPQQWREWDGGLDLSRSWPSPHADIDVDTAGLRKVGETITTELAAADSHEPDGPTSSGLRSWKDTAVAVSQLEFDMTAYGLWPRWIAFDRFWGTVSFIGDRIVTETDFVLLTYGQFGNMIIATSANYAMADSVFDKKISQLRYIVNGKGVHHTTMLMKAGWEADNISDYDAPKIKAMLFSFDVATMLRKGGECAELAAWLISLQSLIEERARQLADVWSGEPSELALEAFRKVHASVRALAHSIGTTGETIIWLANVIHRYQVNFESVVKLGDWEFDDDLPDWLLPSGGGAHDRARDYLRDLNQYVKAAYDALPAEIETLIPGAPSSLVYPDLSKGVKDYWDSTLVGSGEDEP
ncbi:hypothetical protein CA984_03195 [Streptosporangium minutum]|uniref:Uncharacterized protein n=1 Tax=Streptosporangium minutum TaxID=569862 RepID=A0A243RW21_9ACTN|nr:hypothetical protein CA984_03195 [Streptosporangium minutum]